MNTGRLFWGMLLVSAGVLLLLDRIGVFAVSWTFVWQLWPLVLVFWGVALVLAGHGHAGLPWQWRQSPWQ